VDWADWRISRLIGQASLIRPASIHFYFYLLLDELGLSSLATPREGGHQTKASNEHRVGFGFGNRGEQKGMIYI
jgi:hypothetical protein